MSHTVITSWSSEGYAEYGKRFLDTFAEHWSKDIKLIVYYEPDSDKESLAHIRSIGTPVKISLVEGLTKFMNAATYFPLLRGDTGNGYDIRWDARMARKTFMEAHAAQEYGGKVFWVDADIVTHEPVSTTDLDGWLPDDKLCCYLGRQKMYTESGFIGFNAAHPMCLPFLRLYRSLFETGTFLTFGIFHDCVAFDVARRAFEEQHPGQFVNLGDGVDMGPGLNVLANSCLGAKFDHLKGRRKGMKRSPDSDLTVKRTEPYWQAPA